MRMNRRNVLVGLGTIVTGGGAALGTGAFSQVDAERGVTVNVEGDGSAYLGLSAATGAGEFVDSTTEDNNSVRKINIGNSTDSEGVNAEATTTFDPLLDITNNSNTVDISSITFSVSGTNAGVLTVTPDGGFGGSNNNFTGTDTTILDSGETVTMGLKVDLTNSDITGGVDATITITAKTN